MLHLIDKLAITCIQVYIPTHLNVEADFLFWGKLLHEWYLLSSIAQTAFQLGSTRGGSVGILTYQSVLPLLHSGESITSGNLGVECIYHPWQFQVT